MTDIRNHIFTAANGSPSVELNGNLIHSRYNPEREAARFVSGLGIDPEQPARFLVIGEGAGYLSAALLKQFPDASVLAVSFFRGLETLSIIAEHDKNRFFLLTAADGTTVLPFITACVPDHGVKELRIVHWTPSFKADPAWAKSVIDAAGDAVDLLSSNFATIRGFSRRWLLNPVNNLTHERTGDLLYNPTVSGFPVVIAASGPGLNEFIPLIHRYRDRFLLCALPSSLEALYRSGIVPDIIIHSDAGYWARFHLGRLPAFDYGRKKPLIFSSLSAAEPFFSSSRPWHTYCSGYGFFIENDSPFASSGSPCMHMPARGTVAANALDIMKVLTSGDIFFAGLDLASADLRFHVRPHSFDGLFSSGTERFKPEISIRFERMLAAAATDPLNVYSAYFSREAADDRVFRIQSAYSRSIKGISSVTPGFFIKKISGYAPARLPAPVSYPKSAARDTVFAEFNRRLDDLSVMSAENLRLLLTRAPGNMSPRERSLAQLAILLDNDRSCDPSVLRKAADEMRERTGYGT